MAVRITRLGFAAYGLALAVIAIDQLSKFWVVGDLHLVAEGMSIPVLPIFSLTMVWNRGVSYGLLTANNALGLWGLVVFSLAVALALGVWASRQVRRLTALAIGLIIGGAIGNAIDRARTGVEAMRHALPGERVGHVVDFLDFTRLGFPWVFNVADSAISVGVALLLLDSVLTSRAKPEPA